VGSCNAAPIVEKLSGRMRTAFPSLKCFRPPKMHQIACFCRYYLKIFHGVIAPSDPRSAWTQTPISAWLAGVPIVPVLRNDQHWRMQNFSHDDGETKSARRKRASMPQSISRAACRCLSAGSVTPTSIFSDNFLRAVVMAQSARGSLHYVTGPGD